MTLEELLVKIKVEDKQAVKGLEEAKKAADQATGRFDGLRKKLTELGRALGKKPKAEAAKELEKGLKDADRAIAQTERRLQSLQRTASKRTESSDFKSLQEEAKRAEKTIEELARRREKMNEAALAGKYGAPESQVYNEQKAVFDRLRSDENETRGYLKDIQTRMGEMIADGSAYVQSESAKAAGAQIRVEQANLERLKRFRESLNANLEGAVSNPTLQRLQAFLNGVRKAGTGIKNFASKSVKALKGVVSWIEKMGRGFGTVLSKIPLLNNIPKTLKKIKRGLFMGSGMRSLIRLGFAGFFVYRSVQMMREGFKNLAQYSSQTNGDLSMLMSSLATLKNALATAFAPILTAVAPALNYLIQLLVKAATAVAHFTAAFTGKSTVVVAKQQTADYAASLGDAADAAGSANDAAKEYKKTLLGFDQINVLNDADKSSGGSGGGAGGGAGAGDMFETVEVGSGAQNLADRIKEAWKNADFTDLGRDLGDKIAEELNKIPWEKLQNIAYKLGKSIATGFNGLNDSKFWGTLGHSVAESLNTVLTGIEGFVFNFDWKKAGKALADGINHLFLDFDWKKLGKTFSEGAKGVFDALTSLFTTIKWEDIGKSVMSAITSVDWVGIIVSAIKAAGSLASGILSFLKGAFNEAIDGLSNWITSGQIWSDLWDLSKATLDLTLNLVGDAVDLIKTVAKGLSKITIELGGSILESIKKAVEWVAKKLGFKKKEETKPTSTQPYYAMHDYYGFENKIVTVTMKAIQDGSFVKGSKAFASVKSGTATKKLDSYFASWSRWKVRRSEYSGLASAAALKSLTSGFRNWSDWKSKKNEYGEIRDKSATVTINGQLGGNLKSVAIALAKLETGGLYRNGRWQPITMAAGGGSFSSGQMFIAREAGPELVGKIGGGTGVMNNDQIVASVSAGVYEAVVSAMAGNDRDVNVYLVGDANKMFKVVQKEARQYMNSTGLSPFPV